MPVDCSESPFVSVIIPSFNCREYIDTTVSSVLGQTYGSFELIIADDGSSDSSYEHIVMQYGSNKKIKILAHEGHQNKGLAATILLALSEARGTWIAILECDDFWHPDCLRRRVDCVRNSPWIGFCSNKLSLFFESSFRRDWYSTYVSRVQGFLEKKVNSSALKYIDIRQDILLENLFPTFSCMMFKKKYLERLDFDTPVAAWLDWYLYIQLSQVTYCGYIKKELTVWRIHSSSQNSQGRFIDYIYGYFRFRLKLLKLLKFSKDYSQGFPLIGIPRFLIGPLYFRINRSRSSLGTINFIKQFIRKFYGK
ncbi:glycosyltransferase family 2 protein [Parasutterella sp.]|uniref:glycosyltransferase family 2 protein n=1 Tax=Parasutterella sp. TaxID=2049037 RepID=UPI003522413B